MGQSIPIFSLCNWSSSDTAYTHSLPHVSHYCLSFHTEYWQLLSCLHLTYLTCLQHVNLNAGLWAWLVQAKCAVHLTYYLTCLLHVKFECWLVSMPKCAVHRVSGWNSNAFVSITESDLHEKFPPVTNWLISEWHFIHAPIHSHHL